VPVNTPSKAYQGAFTKWQRARDCFEGSDAVKAAGARYLPLLDSQKPGVSGAHGQQKYNEYLLRALFYNAMGRTVEGLSGALFQTAPTIAGPAELEPHLSDITLTGMSAETFGLDATREVLITGRYGMLVDMPGDERAGDEELRPYWCGYRAEDITSWSAVRQRGKETLIQVVLSEVVEERGADPFVPDEVSQYRVLELQDGVYVQSIWRQRPKSEIYDVVSSVRPTRRGDPLTFIPFVFVGPTSTSTKVAKPPLDDLAIVNLSHYRTMADLEHGRHFTALPTPWVAGALGGKPDEPLVIGSGAAWSLDKDGRAGMLEFSGAGLGHLAEAERDKRKMMATLGARLLEEQAGTQETATAVLTRHSGEIATLRTVAQTLEQALTTVTRIHVWWMSMEASPSDLQEVAYEVNKDFFSTKMSPDELRSLIMALQAETISYDTFYAQLVKGELARPGVTMEEEQAAIKASGFGANAQAPEEPQQPPSLSIVEQDGTFYVVDDGTGQTVGEFTSREEAQAAIDATLGESQGPPGVQPGDESATIGNPWRIVKRKGKFVVIKAEDGKVVGTHDTLEKAKAQLKALHANVKDKKRGKKRDRDEEKDEDRVEDEEEK